MIDPLSQRFALRGLDLPNRVVMAPMTHYRSPVACRRRCPRLKCASRATGLGLILTEGGAVPHHAAADHPDTPPPALGVEVPHGWRGVIDAVHAARAERATSGPRAIAGNGL